MTVSGASMPWGRLQSAAAGAARHAYAPYSGLAVGAAGLVNDGRIVVGCNVENVSYGLSLCAECGLVSSLHATGGGRLVAVTVVNAAGELLEPCGRCRQLLWEHGSSSTEVLTSVGARTLAELMPQPFGPADLARGVQ